MDYQFPQQLFPSHYTEGPPDLVLKHCAGNWGSYDRVLPQGSSGPASSWTFTARHQAKGETWRLTEPIPVPLLSPKSCFLLPLKPPNPLDFTEHMKNFFLDHCQDAFGFMGEMLSENLIQPPQKSYTRKSVYGVRSALDMMKMGPRSSCSKSLAACGALLFDVVPAVPTELLGSLLHEELMEQRDRVLFSEGATGGALAFVPFPQGASEPQSGCLVYPGNPGLDRLNFHRVELQHSRGGSSCVDASSSDPFSFQLKGPVRQISCASLFNDCCVAVRSDHLCGVWRFSKQDVPRLLQVVNTREVTTCVSASPHILGEVLVASESGAVDLWHVGKGMQRVRYEDSNLYFNAKSLWRWGEFSAHPRVMVYADRTGVELTDIRESPVSSHTLFRISNTSECRSGERLVLSTYLGDVHTFQHLVTTQCSAYIIDERFPCIAMLKWDHMMKSPPMFCHVVCDSASSGSAVGGAGATKVLLGSQKSQEITLLQFMGGRAKATSSRGPPRALLRPKDSLKHLPVQIPHRLDLTTSRLSAPAAGLTCIPMGGGREGGGDECICILQLTEAGDIFYQNLESEMTEAAPPPAAEDERPAQTAAPTSGAGPVHQRPLPDPLLRLSDENVIGPTQGPSGAKTLEGEQDVHSDSSQDSEPRHRGRLNAYFGLKVMVNSEPELDRGIEVADCRDDTEETGGVENAGDGGSVSLVAAVCRPPPKLSNEALVVWKHWLQKLVQRNRKKGPARWRCQQHQAVPTEDLLPSGSGARDPTEEARVQSLSRDLRACMAKRALLLHGAVSAPLEAPATVAVPGAVETEAWLDDISQRLTVSWQGEEAWLAWWREHLGLNKEDKVKALKRKRRWEKDLRRAAGRRMDLSGSFTSSVSYQSELSDFSDTSGWSSVLSQGTWSENQERLSQADSSLEDRTPRATTPNTPPATQTCTPVAVPTTTPGDQPTTSNALSQTPKRDSTPSNQRRQKRPADDYLHVLFAPQDEAPQHDGYFQGGESATRQSAPPPPRRAQSSALGNLWLDLSQDAAHSQPRTLSQSSRGRPGSSQTSQPKKKSRMGF
ncbi:taf1c [Pungitius sinensis]